MRLGPRWDLNTRHHGSKEINTKGTATTKKPSRTAISPCIHGTGIDRRTGEVMGWKKTWLMVRERGEETEKTKPGRVALSVVF